MSVEALEDERALSLGTRLMDFNKSWPGESIDSLLTRFDLVRHEAQMVGHDIQSIHIMSTSLVRAAGVSGHHIVQLFRQACTAGRVRPSEGGFFKTEGFGRFTVRWHWPKVPRNRTGF